jgi:threonylcarbamoyladenosine tRNA methylthiotransferase MtaB
MSDVEIITFGCRLNAYESEVMREHANAAGLSQAVIVNTCAVTAEAVRQARQAIRKARRLNPHAKIVVTGCAAQIDPDVFARMAEVDHVIGNQEKTDCRTFEGLAHADTEKVVVNDIMSVTETASHLIEGFGSRARAYVQIQNGCDHRCTFCIIPFGRGNSRSVRPNDAVAQARRLVENGHSEIVLTGVDITSYARSLGALVKRILRELPDLKRLRLSSIDSVEVDGDLLDVIGSDARLMPHLHLSLQAGDDIILKRMKRRHLRTDSIAFCDQVRRLRPDMAFGGDIIAGFPTETEEMFARSLDLVDECGLTQLHVFPFSPRPGTPAARMPQVPRDLVKDRARRLREKGEAALRRHLDREVGMQRRVLTERGGIGRTEQFTPVRLAGPVDPGVILDVAVAGHDGRQLIAA